MKRRPPPRQSDPAYPPVITLFDSVMDDPQPVGDEQGEQAVAAAAQAREDASIAARFTTFHEATPIVYELLVRFAREMMVAGYEHGAIGLIWERMRWEVAMSTGDPDGFKLNDHYRSRYARLIMAQEPDLFGFFRTRELRAV